MSESSLFQHCLHLSVDADQPTDQNNAGVDWDSDTNSFEVELWDTAGQEALSHLRTPAYVNAHVFVLAYDMTQPHTLENVLEWYAEIRETCADYCGAIMVGTKYDLWREMLMDGKREELVDIRRVGQVPKPLSPLVWETE